MLVISMVKNVISSEPEIFNKDPLVNLIFSKKQNSKETTIAVNLKIASNKRKSDFMFEKQTF